MTFLELSWATLLSDIERIGRELPYVYFAQSPASDDEICLVVDDDEFELYVDVPEVARLRGFTSGLLVDDVQQVTENLRQQDPAAGREVLLHAIAYYFDRDAFIDLTS